MLQHYHMLAIHNQQLQQQGLETSNCQHQQAPRDQPASMGAAAPAKLKQVFLDSRVS
jgi:hypothetical protein